MSEILEIARNFVTIIYFFDLFYSIVIMLKEKS